jgi:hypothetical protein
MFGDGRGLRVRFDETGNPWLVAVSVLQGQVKPVEGNRDPEYVDPADRRQPGRQCAGRTVGGLASGRVF